jgi:hypothetical protein
MPGRRGKRKHRPVCGAWTAKQISCSEPNGDECGDECSERRERAVANQRDHRRPGGEQNRHGRGYKRDCRNQRKWPRDPLCEARRCASGDQADTKRCQYSDQGNLRHVSRRQDTTRSPNA